ncbi:MAG: tyrosine-type recombinase/integrase [Eubacteriales bacterium]|nr:tyrosine-type recombinase/integrase [Eubacteriales bacterium]
MRNPNGYGSVAKLSGNRRKPFVARKTKGWDDRGYPVYDTIGYYPSREEGMLALADYNRNPYDIDAAKITLKELFEKWSEKKMLKLGDSSQSSLKSAFKHCAQIQGIKYKDLRSFHMQDCIDDCGCGYSTQWAIKNLFGHLDRFAMELDVIQKMYSPLISAEPIPETSKVPFTDEEVKAVWAIRDQAWVDSVLVFLYSGWRIGELLTLETANVNLKDMTFQGGIKTKAGKGRIVPIHSKIQSIVEQRVKLGNRYLFSCDGQKCNSTQYYAFWNGIMDQLGLKHTPHECRHTFRSRLDSAGANKVCIDLMMGHKSKEVGERVYTHKTIQEFRNAIELITR